MKNFYGLVLCDYKDEQVEVHVTASLVNGSLMLSGQDLGEVVERFFGDLDYEYWYSFSPEDTEKLFRELNAEDAPEKVLLERFSGERGCAQLRDFCEEHGIEYHFSCYV